ncbi:hypothetical protein [Actinoplanes awajinensis]|uniref:Uncharacterized protein n=1 Tax=Actinoplanes awajinensis subsp. mycoplanecinus TaxID=135947 RepID=A0A0X3V7K1_9ACTN|nr:hypothetical protein [Actinoplanes awajinensis]KUL40564.1 hypothetical protein ADL15_06115 [Actinoplanes awajinensis subsp. mycoplanecinus]
MNSWEKQWPPTPFPDARVRPAVGTGGIAVRIRTKSRDIAQFSKLFTVGIDDRPVWWGLGRMIAVVEPGEHLVEVRGRLAVESTRRVRVAAGEIVELDFWTPAASFGSSTRGTLVPAPGRRRPGTGRYLVWGWLAAIGLMLAFTLLDVPLNGFFLALLAVPVLAAVLAIWWKRRGDQQYRVAASAEAAAEAGRTDAAGWFLGDAEPPAHLLEGTADGLLVVTGTHALERTRNGQRDRNHVDENGWVPWPELTVDGVQRPLSWQTWCYRLPPGEHDVTFTVRPPRPAAERFAAEQVTRRVTVTAGRVTRLGLHVAARVVTRSAYANPEAYAEITGFTVTTSCTARS